MKAMVLVALVCGCTAAQLPPAGRVLCYAAADQRAQARVDAECSAAGVEFSVCSSHDDIMTQLANEQKACK